MHKLIVICKGEKCMHFDHAHSFMKSDLVLTILSFCAYIYVIRFKVFSIE